MRLWVPPAGKEVLGCEDSVGPDGKENKPRPIEMRGYPVSAHYEAVVPSSVGIAGVGRGVGREYIIVSG